MGFFSWDCKYCGHSIRSVHSVSPVSDWMKHVVVLFKDGEKWTGIYDGYGRVNEKDIHDKIPVCTNPSLYHRSCWIRAGQPKYTEPSWPSEDQGYFVEDTEIEEDKVEKYVDPRSEAPESMKELHLRGLEALEKQVLEMESLAKLVEELEIKYGLLEE